MVATERYQCKRSFRCSKSMRGVQGIGLTSALTYFARTAARPDP